MTYTYNNKGTCSVRTVVELNDDHTIKSVQVLGGCDGNLKGIAKLLPASRLRRGINVEMVDGAIDMDLYVIIEHGTNLAEVSRMLADKVKFVLEDGAQLPVHEVNIHVQGVKVRD